jgi:hypothetical protein
MGKAEVLKIQIINIEPDPRAKARTIISLKVDDNSKAGPWIQAFSIITPEAPITLDQFIDMAIENGIQRPDDPLHAIKTAMEKQEVIDVNLTDNIRDQRP